MTYIDRFITIYNTSCFFQVPGKEKNTDTTESHGSYAENKTPEVDYFSLFWIVFFDYNYPFTLGFKIEVTT